MNLYRLAIVAFKGCLTLGLFVGGWYLRENIWTAEDAYASSLYWLGGALFIAALFFGAPLRRFYARLRFPRHLNRVLPSTLPHHRELVHAALAVREGQEERALVILENIGRPEALPAREAVNWLRAWAGAMWLLNRRRPLSATRDRFPQVHALLFSYGPWTVPLRRQALARELQLVSSRGLDEIACGYLDLVERLIEALSDTRHPLHIEAPALLEFLTGQNYSVAAPERFRAWWNARREALRRGGGVLLAGLRLAQRQLFNESSELFARLSEDGVLSVETETLQGVSDFLALVLRAPMKITLKEMPKLFRELHFCDIGSMNILRFPLAERAEVAEWCHRADELRERKRDFIDNALRLWSLFGPEVAWPTAMVLKRLFGLSGRTPSLRLSFWRKQWENAAPGFELALKFGMEGVAASDRGQRERALTAFQRAYEIDPADPTPLINLVHMAWNNKREQEGRALAQETLRRFPQDASVCVSLGRLVLIHLQDFREAERLFKRARSLDKTSLEAVLYLGEVKLAEGQYTESQSYYAYALQADPELFEARLGLARVYLETRRVELAIEHLNIIVRDASGPVQHLSCYQLYRIHRELGDDEKALEYLDLVPPQFFREPEELDEIAYHLESERQYEKARVFAERAMLLRAKGQPPRDGLEPLLS